MHETRGILPHGWLGFELSVLRRLKFRSAALPFGGEPYLGTYLKSWGIQVFANDIAQWSYTKAVAFIENNDELLTEEDVDIVIDDAYVPERHLNNPALAKWFNDTDACWLDNVRQRAENMASPIKRSLALSLGMDVGDFILSFDQETRGLRQPLSLSEVFKRAWKVLPGPINNGRESKGASHEARDFVAEQHPELLFLRLPSARGQREKRPGRNLTSWREEWVRGRGDFWQEIDGLRAGRLGAPVETKLQYLSFLEDLLHVASHIPVWAIGYTENGFLSANEVVESVSRIRKVDTVYTKDFSELTGARAVMLTAS
jgi:hypothetical protein